MIGAIRNLGILKMIDKFNGEFDKQSLISVDSFLKQRRRAIESGVYAKLQFESIESIKVDRIGIFAIDDGKIRFEEEKVSDDSWKYLFLKTSSQGTYITPTWKKSKSPRKLKKTVEKYIKKSKENNVDWLQNVVKIFTSKDVEIGELNKEGMLERKSFFETVEWAKENKIGVFSVKINGKYNAEIKDILDSALEDKPKTIYQTKEAESFKSSGLKCSLCDKETELFPNVLSGVGINIANVDKPGFFPGVTSGNAGKAFPICAPCAETLYVAKFHVFPELIQNISGHQALIIPHLLESEDKKEGLEIVIWALKLLRKDVSGAKQTEKDILNDLAENKGIATVTFMIGDVGGQSIENIRKVIPDVLPSRLSEIEDAIVEINRLRDDYPAGHPWKSKKYPPPLNGNLMIIRQVLGFPKYSKQKSRGGGRPPFKASSIDTLDLLNAIFLKRGYPLKALLAEFSAKLSYDFLGALSDDDKNKPIYSIQDNITNMVHLLLFLDKLEVIKMDTQKNFVSKYLEEHEGLKPLNDFLSTEAKGLNTKEKQYAFSVGLLFGKLVSIQLVRGVSANALKWLKGLHLSPQDLMEIFFKTRRKLDDYSTPKSAWSEEMRGVAEAIAALGADISEWNISRKEIPYYLCLGQSLSRYYLPSKGKNNQSNEKEGGE